MRAVKWGMQAICNSAHNYPFPSYVFVNSLQLHNTYYFACERVIALLEECVWQYLAAADIAACLVGM